MKQFLLSFAQRTKWWVSAAVLATAPQMAAQSLNLQQVPNLSKCTGDTLTVAMTVAMVVAMVLVIVMTMAVTFAVVIMGMGIGMRIGMGRVGSHKSLLSGVDRR
jgi:hypothetical protein